jgi:hypothetical protein
LPAFHAAGLCPVVTARMAVLRIRQRERRFRESLPSSDKVLKADLAGA